MRQVVERFVCDACGEFYERGTPAVVLPQGWIYIILENSEHQERSENIVCESCADSFWSWFDSRKSALDGEQNT